MITILVVDDEEPIRNLISLVLEDEGYGAIAAANGAEAVEVAARERPHLVLMDIMMPVLDGRAAFVRMRSTPELETLPVVLMSAADPRPIDDGVAGFLSKPFELDELLHTINTVLGRRAPSQQSR